MHRATTVALLSVLISFSSYLVCEERPCPRKGTEEGKPYPIEVISNKPFVAVRVNGSKPLTFILDTGAPWGMLDRTVVPELGLHSSGSSLQGGAGQHSSTIEELAPNACIQFADASVPDAKLHALDFSEISTAEGQRVQGVIGGDFFSLHVVEIDYANKFVQVWDEHHVFRGPGVAVPVDIENGHIYTKASLRTPSGAVLDGKFMIDTGVRLPLLLNRPFAVHQHILDHSFSIPGVTVGIGAGGETRGAVFRLPELSLGSLHIRDAVAVASSDTAGVLAGTDFAGIIGGGLLRRYKVVLDYPHQRVILQALPDSNRPFEFDESGMFLVAQGKDLKNVRILRIIPNSPAGAAGLKENDLLVAINGRPTGEMALDQVRDMFRVDGSYSLRVQRGTQTFATTLHTRDLLARPP